MKLTNFTILVFAGMLLAIVSCETPVGFTSPQPSDISDLTEIPSAFRGIYLCDSDSALIKVNDKFIYSELTQIALTPTKYIEERDDCTIINDSLYMKGKEVCVKVENTKYGYISAVNIQRDTMFALSKFQKARLYNGQLVISQMLSDQLWSIAVLELDENRGVTYRAITDDSDLKKISSITSMTKLHNKEGPDYKVQPKRVELDMLFEDREIFVDCEHYTRVNLIQ